MAESILYQGFEKLYWDTRKELEERLERVQAEPENKSLRLTPEEEAKYSHVSRQLESMVGIKYDFSPRGEDDPISFWGLEKRPYELQLVVVKTLHISLLRLIVSPKAEMSDVVFSATEVWPEDWERLLVQFKLSERKFLTDEFKGYLMSHWTSRPGEKKPILIR